VEEDLAVMDRLNIATAILSIPTPGVHLGDDAEARARAREVNEFTADVVRNRPQRFGFFATLVLPDVDGSLAEAAYAFEHLAADGIVLQTNIRGTYFGDPAWDPLLDELNRRKAVVYLHPSELPGPALQVLPPYAVDFLLDSVRAALCFAKRRCIERFPDLRIILSHGGGFLPYAAARVASAVSADGQYAKGIELLRRFYFDIALASSPYSLPCLLEFADPAHITFGCDWPYAPLDRVAQFAEMFHEFALTDAQRQAITRGNAEKLFPRLA
jgi:predicted TIM-barrel fold metal-dependent hydrolase